VRLFLSCSGIWLAFGYKIVGLVMCVLIIAISFWGSRLPASRPSSVVRRTAAGAASIIGNMIWFLLVGLWMAVAGALHCLPFRSVIATTGADGRGTHPFPMAAVTVGDRTSELADLRNLLRPMAGTHPIGLEQLDDPSGWAL
jgi:hypothetical protein